MPPALYTRSLPRLIHLGTINILQRNRLTDLYKNITMSARLVLNILVMYVMTTQKNIYSPGIQCTNQLTYSVPGENWS